MRLVNLVPFISAELVALLEDIGIRIESDLLFSVTLLEIFSRLPTGITSLENSLRELGRPKFIQISRDRGPGISVRSPRCVSQARGFCLIFVA